MKRRSLIAHLAWTSVFLTGSAWAGGAEVIIEPDYFSGFFVGPTGAFHMSAFNGNVNVEAPEDVIISGDIPGPSPQTANVTLFSAGNLVNNSLSGSAYDGYFGVQGGVGKVFNHRWYMGVMGFGEWGSQSARSENTSNFFTQTTTSGVPFTNLTTSGSYDIDSTVTISNDFGVAVKPGFLVGPKSMIYGKIGAIWADLEVQSSVYGNANVISQNSVTGIETLNAFGSFAGFFEDEDRKVSLLLGIGFEQFFYRDLMSINVEYDYANFGHVTATHQIVGTGTVTGTSTDGASQTTTSGDFASPVISQATANARLSILSAGLNFYFGGHWF